ncbi:hypothetical protein LTR94_021909 [Friedmanniomyces endolithicus]|nr:hypothetical protein LTR94_021909 [Friedmanniomyces endolithicus]
MDPQAFKLKFKYDTALMSLPDAEIADALEEADLVVKSLEFGDLKERAVGLYAAHILKVALKSKSGNSFSDASSMAIAGQSRTIQEDMLTGQRLNVQSGRLRGSVSSKVEEDKDWIEGTVGAGGALVPYAFAHEFGLKGAMAIKAHLRMIKKVFGQPITPRQVMIKAHSRKVDMKERRFMRDSLDEVAKTVPKNIDAAIERGLSSE